MQARDPDPGNTPRIVHAMSQSAQPQLNVVAGCDRFSHPRWKTTSPQKRPCRGITLYGRRLQAAASRTAADRRSSVSCISAASSASTVTRTTGSVPDGRRNARPRPATDCCATASAACTRSACTVALAETLPRRTLTVFCGTRTSPFSAWRRVCPLLRSATSTCRALMMPSPVVARSRHSRWPEASQPRTPPPSISAWCT
ncbi:hypothetical protein G6F59_015762 [Rhizopus arrhizus]|nr:hypothetical protein G6F59_015762 [Rhizopus arrhizus]